MIARLLRRWDDRRRPGAPAIVVDDLGLRCVDEAGALLASFPWSDVVEIRTFKLDLIVVDDIRLAFRVGDDWYEFGEGSPGFMDLHGAIARAFPTVPDDWYTVVMHPAFARNERLLYRPSTS